MALCIGQATAYHLPAWSRANKRVTEFDKLRHCKQALGVRKDLNMCVPKSCNSQI